MVGTALVRKVRRAGLLLLAGALAACSGSAPPPPPITVPPAQTTTDYLIGPGDALQVFVWKNPELSSNIPVRPDGRISLPLINDLQAAGRTPTQLGDDIKTRLVRYVQDPVVTVIVSGFVGPFAQQIRVIGQAAHPQAIPYRENMSLLDVMIQVGGLTQFADGNRATLVRNVNGHQESYRLRIDDLLKDGEIGANTALLPGDVIIVPQSFL